MFAQLHGQVFDFLERSKIKEIIPFELPEKAEVNILDDLGGTPPNDLGGTPLNNDLGGTPSNGLQLEGEEVPQIQIDWVSKEPTDTSGDFNME